MNPLFLCKNTCARVWERKKVLFVYLFAYLCSIILGIVFIKTPAVYRYHLNLCERFVDKICYSDTSVILIFFERTAGCIPVLMLLCVSGVHPAALIFTPAVVAYRGYTCGGSLCIFFSVYRFSGALIALVLYLPIHLLLDAVYMGLCVLSCTRAFRFRFCASDAKELLVDFAVFLAFSAIVCLLEMFLLLVFFHPFGNAS